MKSSFVFLSKMYPESPPTRGAWIEIVTVSVCPLS